MKPIALPALALALAAVASPSTAQDPKAAATPTLFPGGYDDHDALSARLKKMAADRPDAVKLRSLAKSRNGRDVWMATLSKGDASKPAILVVANLEADHVVGSMAAIRMIEALAAETAGPDGKTTLDRATIHVVPRLNPDGAEAVLKGAMPGGVRGSFRLNLAPTDRDRDGRAGEDGSNDLDGDGLATRMRVKDDKAAYVPDEKDPRLLRKADPAKGERGVVSEYVEGRDDDGDGVIDEDPPGGVNLNRHWPHAWAEFDLEAGYSPCSEPECRGLVEFAFAHPEIASVWTFSLNDSLKEEPKKPKSTLDDADLPLFAELSRQFGALVKVEPPAASATVGPPQPPPATNGARPAVAPKAGTRRPEVATSPAPPSLDGTTDGAMSEWAYHQLGVVGIASRLWPSPEFPATPPGGTAPPADGDARWIAWNDRVMGGRAYVPFHPFDHPELGAVEIGGWKPSVRVNPPAERVAPIADAHLAFLKDLASRLPRLEVKDAKAEPKGAGVFEVSAAVVNGGYLPTALAQGVKTKTAPPVLVRVKGPGVKLLSGKPVERIDALGGSGARREYRWLVLAPEGAKSVTVEASCPKAGRVEVNLELK